MLERINNPDKLNEDVELDRALRPRSLKEFIGQSHIKELLDISIRAAPGGVRGAEKEKLAWHKKK